MFGAFSGMMYLPAVSAIPTRATTTAIRNGQRAFDSIEIDACLVLAPLVRGIELVREHILAGTLATHPGHGQNHGEQRHAERDLLRERVGLAVRYLDFGTMT